MSFLFGIVLALLALVSWAVSDLVTTMSLHRENKWKVLMLGQLFGALLIFVMLVFLNQFPPITFEMLAWVVGLGVVNVVGMYSQYEAMHKKGVALTSPLVNSWGVITVVLGVAFYGELISLLQIIGVFLVVAGIFVMSLKKGEKIVFDTPLLYAIISMVMWGAFFFIVKIPVVLFGALLVSMMVKVFTSLFCVPMLSIKKISLFDTIRSNVLFILLIGLIDSAGIVAYNFAIGFAPVSIVATIASSIPALAVLLGVFVLKEKLSRRQALGILSVMAGIIAVASA